MLTENQHIEFCRPDSMSEKEKSAYRHVPKSCTKTVFFHPCSGWCPGRHGEIFRTGHEFVSQIKERSYGKFRDISVNLEEQRKKSKLACLWISISGFDSLGGSQIFSRTYRPPFPKSLNKRSVVPKVRQHPGTPMALSESKSSRTVFRARSGAG